MLKRKSKERCTIYDGCPDGWINEENLNISLILPAKLIPDESTVTKRTGLKEYTLRSSIKIVPYIENGDEYVKNDPVEVTSEGSLFLIDGNPYGPYGYTCISEETLLRWVLKDEVDMDIFQSFLENRNNGIPQ